MWHKMTETEDIHGYPRIAYPNPSISVPVVHGYGYGRIRIRMTKNLSTGYPCQTLKSEGQSHETYTYPLHLTAGLFAFDNPTQWAVEDRSTQTPIQRVRQLSGDPFTLWPSRFLGNFTNFSSQCMIYHFQTRCVHTTFLFTAIFSRFIVLFSWWVSTLLCQS